MRAVGSTYPREDALLKVTGAAAYPGDIDLPGQVWLKIVFAGVPHAQIHAIDTAAAEAAPGVVTVLTARDVPVNEYGLAMFDQPVLCGPGSTAQAGRVRWEADQVALVVAKTQAQAEADQARLHRAANRHRSAVGNATRLPAAPPLRLQRLSLWRARPQFEYSARLSHQSW